MSTDPGVRARPDVEMHVLPDGSALLFDPVESEGHVLNQLGALAWDYCDGALSREEIASEIADLIPAVERAHDAVLEVLDGFAERGLLLTPASHAARE